MRPIFSMIAGRDQVMAAGDEPLQDDFRAAGERLLRLLSERVRVERR
jgi:hypothetical protein